MKKVTDESITRQAIGQWCNGHTCPNFKTVPVIAEFFSVSTDYLLTDTNIKTVNHGLRAACEYTGLSEEAVERFHNNTLFSSVISHIVSSSAFLKWYTIRVYRGYDISGRRLKPYLMTWKLDDKMIDRQIQKELQWQALEFEKRCESGEDSGSNIKLCDFCDKYLEMAKTFLSPAAYELYKRNIIEYVKPALGQKPCTRRINRLIQGYLFVQLI